MDADSMRIGRWILAAGVIIALVVSLAARIPATALAVAVPHASSTGWAGPYKIDSSEVQVLSCPSRSFCAAIDENGDMLTFNGSAWSAPASEDLQNGAILQELSCASSSFCAGIDGNENAYVYNGQSWSAPSKLTTDPGNDGYITSLSCGSSTFCIAVGGDTSDESFTYNGSVWSTADTFYTSVGADTTYATTVSCVVDFCAAGDFKGQLFTFAGGSWSAPTPTSVNQSIFDVSCSAASSCVASSDGATFDFKGSAWGDAASNPSIKALSCVNAEFCEGIGGLGASTFNGSSWGPTVSAVNGPSVSCATTTFCVASGAMGEVFAYTGAPAGTTPPGSGTAHSATVTGVAVSGTTASVALSCQAAAGARCAGTITEQAKLRVRVGRHDRTRTVTVASTAYTVAAGRHAKVRLKLNSAGRDALASTGRLKVSLVVLTGTGKSAKPIATRSLTYRSPKK